MPDDGMCVPGPLDRASSLPTVHPSHDRETEGDSLLDEPGDMPAVHVGGERDSDRRVPGRER